MKTRKPEDQKTRRPENQKTRTRLSKTFSRFPAFPFSRFRTVPLLILLLLTPALLSGNGGDEELASGSRELEFAPTEGNGAGEFFAEVEIRDDLLAVDEYMMRVQVHPVPTPWPQTQIPRTAFGADIQVLIKLRGVSVPRITSSRDRPMAETRRETIRFDEAMRFVWHLMDATDHLILSSPEVVSGTEMVMCDVYFELAGTRLSLAKALVVAGHARYEPHDWGKRVVEPLK